ncbi:MAG: S46 family peptidase [Bacteroidales bacterium]|nr:S46 family peptidase [Lentimicrobiaceae bacterium]MDD5694898.1 S46 family peptidase [Bacteroidales bacterium]
MKKYSIFFVFFVLFLGISNAQEGMWLLNQIGQLDLNNKGLQIPVSDIYSKNKAGLCNAVVQLGGGTASFVSPEGLLLTNHHVAFAALQRSSSVNSNYLSDGFLASKRTEEIAAPGYRALLLTEMRDVTDEIIAAGKGITDVVERDKAINRKIAGMTEDLEKGKEDVRAVVSELYNGKQYMLYLYKQFKDIRIVYSPPLSIGKYGGETDNWMWPRHTGDFSFLRVYVAPDGTGREYSAENMPYKPKVWLKVAKDDLKDGDFNFIVGFPGFTTRYRSSNSVAWNFRYNYPFAIQNYGDVINILDEKTKKDPEGKLKVASLRTGLANVMKNYEGKVAGFEKTDFLNKKLDFEKEYLAWANSSPGLKQKYGNIISKEKEQYDILEKTRDRDNVFGIVQGLSGTQLGVAATIYLIARELEKPESERQPGLDENAVKETIDNLQYNYSGYFEPVDREMLLRALRMAQSLPQDQRITGLDYLFNDRSRSLEQFVDEAYGTSMLNDPEYAKSLFGKSSAELEALSDPFITIVARLYPLSEEIRKNNEVFAANVTDIRKEYMDALYAWKGTNLYPDADGTMRFTWGPVKGYRPADAIWYYPFTSLRGVVEKNTGREPFNAPAGLVELYRNKDYGSWMDPVLQDVPVAFLNQCDITGGNSGSPVLNARGELIGVVFDGNYEAMISDWQYDYELQRSITADIRYVLFVTEKFGKAGFILDEMGLER